MKKILQLTRKLGISFYALLSAAASSKITEKDYLEAKKIVQEYEIKYLNISVVRKSSPLIEGKTKSNVKKNKQIGRLAPPPPPMKR